jgi:protein-tyrosine phosphatase
MDPYRILFVCLGNICRSPLAEGVFLHLVREGPGEGAFEVDSAGTGSWHVGEPADRRARAVARKHGVDLQCRARQVREEDFREFDLIVAMDRENLARLEALRDRAGAPAEIRLLREFDPEGDGDLEVPDPYYGGPEGFDRVYEMVHRSCAALLESLAEDDTKADSPA